MACAYQWPSRAILVPVAFLASSAGIFLSVTPLAANPVDPSPNIKDYIAKDLTDFTANVHLVKYDANAGRHINKDFGLIYEWMKKSTGDMQVRYKEEDKFRLDGKFGPSKAQYIINGTEQYVRYPSLGLNTHTSLGDTPGKRKTLLDIGLISQDYLSYTEAEFQGSRPFKGVVCAVFNISYRDKAKDSSHRVVWIDPKTKVTLKREEYSQAGKLLSIWYYHDPKEVAPGVFMPVRIEIDDNTGKEAGETEYRNVKVNQGLEDSLFQ